MNKCIIVGNLTKDPERKKTGQGTTFTNFTVAAQRRYKNQTGSYDADFINCVAWRNTADFVANHFQKGSAIGVIGSIQTRSYDDQNGSKRYVTEIVVDEVEFVGRSGKAESTPKATQQETSTVDDIFGDELADYQPATDDEEWPF